MRLTSLVLGLLVALPLHAQEAPAPAAPRLLVFITVDQLKGDYFDRFGGELTGGFHRMLERGAFFTRAYQDHAVTETAPGHASLLSGRFPRSTGIVSNDAGVGDTSAHLLGSRGDGASPYRFRGGVLMDWLRIADPAARGLSVSRKDRGAILPFGRSHEPVFWYASDGRFTTSTWYADTLPAWVQRFNERRLPQSMAGRAWTLLRPLSQYPEPDSVPVEGDVRHYAFPHVLSASPDTAASQLVNYPFMDEILAQVALEGMRAYDLGADDHTDIMAVSFSTFDAIGHDFGPDSREIHDELLRLDRVIGALIDSVYARVDSTRVIFALSADHGITRFPELSMRDTTAVREAYVDLRPALLAFRATAAPHGIASRDVRLSGGRLDIDAAALARTGYDPSSAVAAFLTAARAVPGVSRATTVQDLARGDSVNDAHVRRWLHMLPADARALAVVSVKPGHVWGTDRSGKHGTANDDDAHVPIVFMGAPFRPGRYTGFVRTVDIAPTLAAVLGIRPTEPLDGRVLTPALRPGARLP